MYWATSLMGHFTVGHSFIHCVVKINDVNKMQKNMKNTLANYCSNNKKKRINPLNTRKLIKSHLCNKLQILIRIKG